MSWSFQSHVARAPRLMAVRWTPDVDAAGVVVVSNGYDQTYAYIQNTHFAYGTGQDSTGEIGDYLVYVPGTDKYYFIRAGEFDKLFVLEQGLTNT